jgi:hypothetical protein
MRPYRIEEEVPDEEDAHPGVVRIGSNSRSRSTVFGVAADRRPWTPRDTALPDAPAREDQSPLTARRPGLSRMHQLMIASFAIVCIGMVLGMFLVRVWDDASSAVAALPPEGFAIPNRSAAQPAAQAATADSGGSSAQPGTGAITSEIRVLQPNYTVAPGDTLGIIARRHGTNVDALASINNLENRNSLGVGQKLIIP